MTVVNEEVLESTIRAAVKQLNLEEYSDDEDEEEGEDDDYLWKEFESCE